MYILHYIVYMYMYSMIIACIYCMYTCLDMHMRGGVYAGGGSMRGGGGRGGLTSSGGLASWGGVPRGGGVGGV